MVIIQWLPVRWEPAGRIYSAESKPGASPGGDVTGAHGGSPQGHQGEGPAGGGVAPDEGVGTEGALYLRGSPCQAWQCWEAANAGVMGEGGSKVGGCV